MGSAVAPVLLAFGLICIFFQPSVSITYQEVSAINVLFGSKNSSFLQLCIFWNNMYILRVADWFVGLWKDKYADNTDTYRGTCIQNKSNILAKYTDTPPQRRVNILYILQFLRRQLRRYEKCVADFRPVQSSYHKWLGRKCAVAGRTSPEFQLTRINQAVCCNTLF